MTFDKGLVAIGVLAVGLIAPILCGAEVTGICSGCHTMHNSEQGSPVAFTRNISDGQAVTRDTAFGKLLKTDCLGCHTNPNAETITTMGESVVPVVLNISKPTYPPNGNDSSVLAGGNFYWGLGGVTNDVYVHNVYGISDTDSNLSLPPGGVDHSSECGTSDCHGTLSSVGSGCNGCHVPSHHAGSTDVVAGKSKGWYRFLGSVMQHLEQGEGETPNGVVGIEASDWEQNPSSTSHNTYQGDSNTANYTPHDPDNPTTTPAYMSTGTISQKCIGCHSLYHSETSAGSIWIRHPVEVAIPNSGEFTNFTTYDPMLPVARPNVSADDAGFSSIKLGSDVVSCVTCHRAHGSP